MNIEKNQAKTKARILRTKCISIIVHDICGRKALQLDSKLKWCQTLGMADSIFTKIIKGEVPSHKVHEDDLTLAFMDINPIQAGMVVVVSKKQIDHVWDLPEEDYQALMKTVRGVAKQLKIAYNKQRVAVIIEGFEVPHAHVKVFPVDDEHEVRTHPTGDKPDHAALAEMAKRLAF